MKSKRRWRCGTACSALTDDRILENQYASTETLTLTSSHVPALAWICRLSRALRSLRREKRMRICEGESVITIKLLQSSCSVLASIESKQCTRRKHLDHCSASYNGLNFLSLLDSVSSRYSTLKPPGPTPSSMMLWKSRAVEFYCRLS